MNVAYKNTRTIFIISLAALAFFFLWAETVAAQETAAPSESADVAAIAPAGITPQSPFYAVDRLFERTGLFFAFGRTARAERRLALAEERLSEARVLAEDGDDRAEALTDEYETTFEQATIEAELSENENTMARIAEQATRHSAVLDRVAEQVPEQARARVLEARDRFVENHIAVMRTLAENNPERAATIFANAAERRALAAERRAERVTDAEEKLSEKSDEVKKRLEEYEKYAAFGEEVSLIARNLRTGEATVDDVVKKATARHIEVLERVREKAPEAAQQGLENALQNAERVRALRADALTPTQVEERLQQRREESDERREKMKESLETREARPLLPRALERRENAEDSGTGARNIRQNTVTPAQNRIESRVAPATGTRVTPAVAPGILPRVQNSEGVTQ
ncbi:MAG: hypothetical protein HYS73_00185 [Parcubacteria group bacterium]|nr:hypothetical protein [Parcubacteria group bacterium]